MNVILEGQPVSVNQMYRGRRFLTPEGRSIKLAYAAQARRQYRGAVLTEPLRVDMHVYFPTRNRSDLDNVIKGIWDSLTGILWKDDRQVRELHAYKRCDPENPRAELLVMPL
jgi:Holliday junction resolvase RusA-like endonuclease